MLKINMFSKNDYGGKMKNPPQKNRVRTNHCWSKKKCLNISTTSPNVLQIRNSHLVE